MVGLLEKGLWNKGGGAGVLKKGLVSWNKGGGAGLLETGLVPLN